MQLDHQHEGRHWQVAPHEGGYVQVEHQFVGVVRADYYSSSGAYVQVGK